jgi:bifunctional non-homologous end joining protein LigD
VSGPLPSPMLAVAATGLPTDDGPRWAYEMKWDGYRAIIEVTSGRLRIASRRGNDITARYPELTALPDPLSKVDVVLDGEIVVLDDGGRPSFQALQQHTSAAAVMVFDVLHLDGHDLTALAWSERRAVLERLGISGTFWQTPAVSIGHGPEALETARRLGLEGVVAKRLDSPYRVGRRSSEWRKVKLDRRQEFVVGGWLPGKGRLQGTVGALLVGYHEEPGGMLHYAGRAGSGLGDATRERLATTLVRRPTSPFEPVPPLGRDRRDAVWVEPTAVVEVRFSDWTSDGLMRQPTFLGERDDKDPAEVVREV